MTDSSFDIFPPSLWSASATPAQDFSELNGERRVEVAVIGGGYTGLSCAIHLAQRGIEGIVLEARKIGWGASGRNGGQVIAGLKYNPDELLEMFGEDAGERLVRAVGAAPDLVFELIKRYKIECDAIKNGWLQGAHSQRGLAAQLERATQWKRRGVNTSLLDARQASRHIGSDWYLGAWFDPRGGTVQPLSYVRGLGRAASGLGVSIFEGTPALHIKRSGSGWQIDTPKGRVLAQQIVIGSNAYGDKGIWPGLGESVVPARSLQVATKPLPTEVLKSILPYGQGVSETRRVLRYSRLDASGRFIMGSRAPDRDFATLEDTKEIQRDIAQIFPQLSGVGLEYVWVGRVAMTQDFLPHLHELAKGVYAGLGYNGRGIAMATMMGKMLADRVAGTPALALDFPTVALKPIRFHRLTPLAAKIYTQWYRLLDRIKV